ncbi:DUF6766 family protein (plasmid) [Agrobacterium radiobacter]|jgi:hypothetical protein|uniref:Transmembrane protein n=1 Tax=Agrobacterium tumefaciens str. B6 TaxID=1183423 RepID=A0A822V853_AGRTU|nr:DUF6766 family protein [Agrobacterium tumefaciens]AYM09207.1 membrane protein [Agrobacterium tumefaciens]KWT81348.1 hypothetical protein ASB65_16605 [Agrobacterium tumefaciens str. B6]NSZ33365.1 hypothetical protein [Agrobacterium tumefaciens]NTA05922.1 hypothetical protein [Agrobacterium tumefaciens]NTA94919.1 hypothetical protein [Agrobacterium tumefaciens]
MRLFRDNGLTIILVLASLLTIGGMLATGWAVHNEELAQHQALPLTLFSYAKSGHFLSALFENWESEFLQMSAYVVLTAFLFQKGSSESKDPDEVASQDEDPERKEDDPEAPWPVKAGGLIRTIYSYSLGLALFFLFIVSFVLHLKYSADAAALEAVMHGEPETTLFAHLGSVEFWFESFQNWQSEFLSTAVLVVLSIFLRFRGSPESKPVTAPHGETGG